MRISTSLQLENLFFFEYISVTQSHYFLSQVKRVGDKNVRCTMLFMLNYLPPQFKLDSRLARLLGIHTQTRPVIIQGLWQYIKSHKLQVGVRFNNAFQYDLIPGVVSSLSFQLDQPKSLRPGWDLDLFRVFTIPATVLPIQSA